MLLRKEESRLHRSGSEVLTTSWMPEVDAKEESNSANGEEHGWLACGNRGGIVSITLTSLSRNATKIFHRTNFNLCDHKNPVHIVEWNPIYRKLATCSALGAILVYQKSDDRWTVDLVNDRPHQVEEFRWSRSGERVMIVYSDGLLVVGSVQGQRLWHRMMELRGGSRRRVTPGQGGPGHQQPMETYNGAGHQFYAGVSQHQVGQMGAPTTLHPDNETTPGSAANTATEDDLGPRLPRQDEMPTLTCGTWSPRDRTITVATSTGYLLSFPASWERVRQVDHLLRFNDFIMQLEWSCPRFLPATDQQKQAVNNPANESTETAPAADQSNAATTNLSSSSAVSQSTTSVIQVTIGVASPTAASTSTSEDPGPPDPTNGAGANDIGESVENREDQDNIDDTDGHLLAVAFFSGFVYILRSLDDPAPVVIETRLWRLRMAWNQAGTMLAVAGFVRSANLQCQCSVRLYSREGRMIYAIPIDSLSKPIMNLSWAHNDRRLFVAASHYVHTLCLEEEIPRLDMSVACHLYRQLRGRADLVDRLPTPAPLRDIVHTAFAHTLQSCLPQPSRLREFVVLPRSERLFCTVVRHDRDEFATHYTIYLEFLGGLIPLLRAKRVGKLKPDFIIYDPKITSLKDKDELFHMNSSDEEGSGLPSSEEEDSGGAVEPGCGSPRGRRSNKKQQRRKYGRNEDAVGKAADIVFYDNNLPEMYKLVEVQANVWGTRFQLNGMQSFLPASLGEVFYKKSVLHLQPREMTVRVAELTPDMPSRLSHRNGPNRRHPHGQNWLVRNSSGLEIAGHSPTVGCRSSVGPASVGDILYIDDIEDSSLVGIGVATTIEDAAVQDGVRASTDPNHSAGLMNSHRNSPLSQPSFLVNRCVARLLHSESPSGSGGGGGVGAGGSPLQLASRSAPTTPVRRSRWKKSQLDMGSAGPASGGGVGRARRTVPTFLRHSGSLESEDIGVMKKPKAVYKKGSRISDVVTVVNSNTTAEPDCLRYFILNNKKPNWNEENQVYQLDFGGRVTQESAKNFQIEQDGKQVLQFGRLSENTFALDFQYPFSPIQAFGVALANVTTRFK